MLDYDNDIAPLLKQDLSYAEIAAKLGVTKSAVGSQIRRQKLRTEAKRFAEAVPYVNASDRAACFLNVMATDVNDTLQRVRVRKLPTTNEKEIERERALELLNKRARLTYGLDSAANKSVVVGISVKLGTNLQPEDIEVQATTESTPVSAEQNTPDSAAPAD